MGDNWPIVSSIVAHHLAHARRQAAQPGPRGWLHAGRVVRRDDATGFAVAMEVQAERAGPLKKCCQKPHGTEAH